MDEVVPEPTKAAVETGYDCGVLIQQTPFHWVFKEGEGADSLDGNLSEFHLLIQFDKLLSGYIQDLHVVTPSALVTWRLQADLLALDF